MRMGSPRRWTLLAVSVATVLALIGLFAALPSGDKSSTEPRRGAAPPSGLTVRGNQLVDEGGKSVRLRGFNTSGTEYACIEGWGIFDLPGAEPTRVPDAVVRRMAQWRGANTVRVPLNEQCWLGLGVGRAHGGSTYQRAIAGYVRLLHSYGFAVVLDLHRSAPANGRSLQQEPMPDRDHSIDFWREVATAYKNDTSVIFDLFNEPWPYGDVDSPRAWQCWRDGGCRLTSANTGDSFTAAGMNELIAAVRATGARNVLAVGGIFWAEVLNGWLQYRPSDPLDNLMASFHGYAFNEHCVDERCYDSVLAPLAAEVPLFAGEIGPDVAVNPDEARCPPTAVGDSGFSRRLLDWLDRHDAGYTAWTWNASDDCLSLVQDARGTPTPRWGREFKSRLARG
jgi:endoglucanase